MNGGGVPPALADAVEDVRTVTRALLLAAESEDPAAIDHALDQRGAAVERLERAAAAVAVEIDPLARKRIVAALALEAGEVEARLAGLLERTRVEAETLVRGSRAVHGYAQSPPDPSALDRSG